MEKKSYTIVPKTVGQHTNTMLLKKAYMHGKHSVDSIYWMECVYGKRDDREFHFDNESVRCTVFIVCISMWMEMNLYIPILKNGTFIPSSCLYLSILSDQIRQFPSNMHVCMLHVYDFPKNNWRICGMWELRIRNGNWRVCVAQQLFIWGMRNTRFSHIH